jgi:hypothetical protein
MLNFALDAWTSPCHKAFVAITVHLAPDDSKLPSLFVLDLVEVAASHTGTKLAEVFANTVKEFGIAHKVCYYIIFQGHILTIDTGSQHHVGQCFEQ